MAKHKASKTQIGAAARSLAAFHERNPAQLETALRKRSRELGVTPKVLRDAVWRVIERKQNAQSVDAHLAAVVKRHRWGFPL